MRAGTKRAAFHALAAAAALTHFSGCVIPGASFGTEPLQVRFADAARRTIEADAVQAPQPFRSAAARPIVLAAHSRSAE